MIVENYLIDYMNDPLIDLPINSNELLMKIIDDYDIEIFSEEIVNQILLKLSYDYKIIK